MVKQKFLKVPLFIKKPGIGGGFFTRDWFPLNIIILAIIGTGIGLLIYFILHKKPKAPPLCKNPRDYCNGLCCNSDSMTKSGSRLPDYSECCQAIDGNTQCTTANETCVGGTVCPDESSTADGLHCCLDENSVPGDDACLNCTPGTCEMQTGPSSAPTSSPPKLTNYGNVNTHSTYSPPTSLPSTSPPGFCKYSVPPNQIMDYTRIPCGKNADCALTAMSTNIEGTQIKCCPTSMAFHGTCCAPPLTRCGDNCCPPNEECCGKQCCSASEICMGDKNKKQQYCQPACNWDCNSLSSSDKGGGSSWCPKLTKSCCPQKNPNLSQTPGGCVNCCNNYNPSDPSKPPEIIQCNVSNIDTDSTTSPCQAIPCEITSVSGFSPQGDPWEMGALSPTNNPLLTVENLRENFQGVQPGSDNHMKVQPIRCGTAPLLPNDKNNPFYGDCSVSQGTAGESQVYFANRAHLYKLCNGSGTGSKRGSLSYLNAINDASGNYSISWQGDVKNDSTTSNACANVCGTLEEVGTIQNSLNFDNMVLPHLATESIPFETAETNKKIKKSLAKTFITDDIAKEKCPHCATTNNGKGITDFNTYCKLNSTPDRIKQINSAFSVVNGTNPPHVTFAQKQGWDDKLIGQLEGGPCISQSMSCSAIGETSRDNTKGKGMMSCQTGMAPNQTGYIPQWHTNVGENVWNNADDNHKSKLCSYNSPMFKHFADLECEQANPGSKGCTTDDGKFTGYVCISNENTNQNTVDFCAPGIRDVQSAADGDHINCYNGYLISYENFFCPWNVPQSPCPSQDDCPVNLSKRPCDSGKTGVDNAWVTDPLTLQKDKNKIRTTCLGPYGCDDEIGKTAEFPDQATMNAYQTRSTDNGVANVFIGGDNIAKSNTSLSLKGEATTYMIRPVGHPFASKVTGEPQFLPWYSENSMVDVQSGTSTAKKFQGMQPPISKFTGILESTREQLKPLKYIIFMKKQPNLPGAEQLVKSGRYYWVPTKDQEYPKLILTSQEAINAQNAPTSGKAISLYPDDPDFIGTATMGDEGEQISWHDLNTGKVQVFIYAEEKDDVDPRNPDAESFVNRCTINQAVASIPKCPPQWNNPPEVFGNQIVKDGTNAHQLWKIFTPNNDSQRPNMIGYQANIDDGCNATVTGAYAWRPGERDNEALFTFDNGGNTKGEGIFRDLWYTSDDAETCVGGQVVKDPLTYSDVNTDIGKSYDDDSACMTQYAECNVSQGSGHTCNTGSAYWGSSSIVKVQTPPVVAGIPGAFTGIGASSAEAPWPASGGSYLYGGGIMVPEATGPGSSGLLWCDPLGDRPCTYNGDIIGISQSPQGWNQIDKTGKEILYNPIKHGDGFYIGQIFSDGGNGAHARIVGDDCQDQVSVVATQRKGPYGGHPDGVKCMGNSNMLTSADGKWNSNNGKNTMEPIDPGKQNGGVGTGGSFPKIQFDDTICMQSIQSPLGDVVDGYISLKPGDNTPLPDGYKLPQNWSTVYLVPVQSTPKPGPGAWLKPNTDVFRPPTGYSEKLSD